MIENRLQTYQMIKELLPEKSELIVIFKELSKYSEQQYARQLKRRL